MGIVVILFFCSFIFLSSLSRLLLFSDFSRFVSPAKTSNQKLKAKQKKRKQPSNQPLGSGGRKKTKSTKATRSR